MKVVGLLSGGKDSCYNLCHCLKNGHQLIALATLGPGPDKDELDSYLYQTVGQDGVHLIAQALDVPLYRRTITGSALELKSEYGSRVYQSEMSGILGDETEDMYQLLCEVKRLHPDINALSVGAILSTYQRVRVEHVCQRLGLVSLAYLWQRDQSELLEEMIQSGLESILIKVASIGLESSHLNQSLGQMQPKLEALHSRFGVHVCGEGGEYETFTIDCPIFKSKINLKQTQIVDHPESSPMAPVAYLRLCSATLSPRTGTVGIEAVKIPPVLDHDSQITLEALTHRSRHVSPVKRVDKPIVDFLTGQPTIREQDGWVIISSVAGSNLAKTPPLPYSSLQDEVSAAFSTLADLLCSKSLAFTDIAHINLSLRSMDDFVEVNEIYKSHFGISPPTRACIATKLAQGCRVMLDAIARRSEDKVPNSRFALHVQSRSYWAPANIGPYSQAVSTGGRVFLAGQIGLMPSSLSLPSPQNFNLEAVLSLQHVKRILATFPSTRWIESILCYITDQSHLAQARECWRQTSTMYDARIPILFIVVEELPKGALIEWQVVASDGVRPFHIDQQELDDDEDRCSDMHAVYSLASSSYASCLSPNSRLLMIMGCTSKAQSLDANIDALHVQVFHLPHVETSEARRQVIECVPNLGENDGISTLCVTSIALGPHEDDCDETEGIEVGFWIMGCLR